MNYFLMWFFRPVAEFFGAIFLVFIVIGIYLLFDTYYKWIEKRNKK